MTIDPTTRAAIAELNARFSWALDLHDWSELREVLAPDEHYVSTGREFHDAESVIASFEGRTGARTTRHGLGNLLLRAGPGGTVLGRSSRHSSASNTEPVHGVPHPAETPFLRGFHRDRHRPVAHLRKPRRPGVDRRHPLPHRCRRTDSKGRILRG